MLDWTEGDRNTTVGVRDEDNGSVGMWVGRVTGSDVVNVTCRTGVGCCIDLRER